jgi:DNA-binding transcriptional ArsR family regulator
VCVTHIQAKSGLAQSTVSSYMTTLERAGLVVASRIGKWTHYRRDEARIAALARAFRQLV